MVMPQSVIEEMAIGKEDSGMRALMVAGCLRPWFWRVVVLANHW